MSLALSRRAVWAASVFASLVVAACGSSSGPPGASGKEIKQLSPSFIGAQLDGLDVTAEDVSSTVHRVSRSYVDGVAVYSMRRKDLVEATLQLNHFSSAAKYHDPKFRSSLVNQVGGSTPSVVRVGKDLIYQTTGSSQRLAMWFRNSYLFILSVRNDFDQPRSLLRTSLALTP